MNLESIIKITKPKVKSFFPALLVGTLTSVGCARTSSDHQEQQGGNAGSSHQGGAAGFDGAAGYGGNGGSEEACVPNNSLTCHEGEVYWQDSCGNVGQLKEECPEKQLCENEQCVYDCNATTPTSGCMEQHCSFYDTFDYGTCKWDNKFGAPVVMNEKLRLEGNDLVETKGGPFSLASVCNGDFVARYKVELLPNSTGTLKVSHRNSNPNFSGITITHYPFNENNTLTLDCNGYEVSVGGFDLQTQKKLEVRKTVYRLELYVDNAFASHVLCNQTETPTPVYKMVMAAGSAALPQAMNIDDVALYCSN